jgi:serine phosphatase RsbU (regulator of sigma subunit)
VIDLKDRRHQAGILIVLIVAITGLRLLESQTGPLYLIPVVMAAIWFGRWWGLGVGLAASVLTRLTLEINGGMPDPTAFAELVRLAVYGGLGYVVGALQERQHGLHRELVKRELELEEVRTLQDALAPTEPPQRPSLELATCYLPAQHGVSGDFHLVVPGSEGSTLIAVGDAAGPGLDAAKRAWYVRTLIASSADATADPARILERANRSLIDDSGFGAPFVTAACIVFHPLGRVEWALAGHDGPLRLDTGRPLDSDGSSGLPLGVSDEVGSGTGSAELDRGAGLLLYTDGLTEARRPGANGDAASAAPGPAQNGSELFGEDRVEGLLRELNGVPAAAVLRRVQHEVRDFTGGRLADDLCMIAMRFSADPGAKSVS